jgi:hypothetical protein
VSPAETSVCDDDDNVEALSIDRKA